MNFTGWTKTKLHIHLKELIKMELVVKQSGRKNSLQHYKLLYDGHSFTVIFTILTNPA